MRFFTCRGTVRVYLLHQGEIFNVSRDLKDLWGWGQGVGHAGFSLYCTPGEPELRLGDEFQFVCISPGNGLATRSRAILSVAPKTVLVAGPDDYREYEAVELSTSTEAITTP